MKSARKSSFIVSLVMALILISCQISAGGPTPPRPVSASTQTVTELNEMLNHVLNNPDPSGSITITLTENQLTSLLEQQLSQQAKPLLQSPQILLQNNQVEIFGVVQTNLIKANARLALQVSADQNGKLTAALTSVNLGSLPVPQSFVENISALINAAMQESISPLTSGIRIEGVNIADGLLTITGKR